MRNDLDENRLDSLLKEAYNRRKSIGDTYDDYTLQGSEKPINVPLTELQITNIPADKTYAWFPYYSNGKESYQVVADAISRGWDFVDRYAHPEIPVLTLNSRNSLNDFQGLTRTENPHTWDREEKYIKNQGLVLMQIDKMQYERATNERMKEFHRKYQQMNPKEFNKGKSLDNGDTIMSITAENYGL